MTVDVIPAPASVEHLAGGRFTPGAARAASPAAQGVADYLAPRLGAGGPELVLELVAGLEREAYELDTVAGVLRAGDPAGLFRGAQTLLQLLPDAPPVRISDAPRYAYRGVMLDIARHFFGVEDVLAVIDLAAGYKLNALHLHLTDDQGWRLAIDGWPKLTSEGAATEVGGGPGGFYTRADYERIVAHAASRHITVVPEIDVPGHANAALNAYPELGDGRAPGHHTTIHSPNRSLEVRSDVVRRFLADVVGQVAALTPGPYVHLGADEDEATEHADYVEFVRWAAELVGSHGKRPIVWEEAAVAPLPPGTVVQHWTNPERVRDAAEQGLPLIMSPAPHTYLDQKYDDGTELGLSWAGNVEVRDAYEWDPGDVLGVEAALWTETVEDLRAIEYMLLPRLPAVAEVAWSAARGWDGFAARLAAHGARWAADGVSFHRSPQVAWT